MPWSEKKQFEGEADERQEVDEQWPAKGLVFFKFKMGSYPCRVYFSDVAVKSVWSSNYLGQSFNYICLSSFG